MEMMVKVVARGALCGPDTYLKDGWNVMDGILVTISLVNIVFDLVAPGDSPKIFAVIRVLRSDITDHRSVRVDPMTLIGICKIFRI